MFYWIKKKIAAIKINYIILLLFIQITISKLNKTDPIINANNISKNSIYSIDHQHRIYIKYSLTW